MAQNNNITFRWSGKDASGKLVKGELAAPNIESVKVVLRRQAIVPIKVRKKPNALFSPRQSAIKPGDIAIFSRMLSTLMSSGVPLMQSMQMIGEGHENPSMKSLILSVKNDVESGESLALSLGKFPLYFDALFVNLVDAGEQSGTLESHLDEIATYKEKTEVLKAKIKKAMVYPVTILVIAFIVTAILMVFVIPEFEALFQGLGAELPALTQIVIDISKFFQEWWWLIVGSILISIYSISSAKKRSKKVQHTFDRNLLKLPVVGNILRNGAVARFSRTFSTMLNAGVPLVEALVSVAGATGNVVFSDATLAIRDQVATGTQVNVAMKNSKLFPNMVVQMTAIGEDSGELDAMLAKIADFYEREVDDAVDNMTALLEPLIMAFLGIVIGTLVIAMYLPIFQMGDII